MPIPRLKRLSDDTHESFSEQAVERIKNRKTKVQGWFLDLNLVMNYWGGGTKRAYHHTAPINALYGLHEALVMLAKRKAWKTTHGNATTTFISRYEPGSKPWD